jgi:hypothetical protein
LNIKGLAYPEIQSFNPEGSVAYPLHFHRYTNTDLVKSFHPSSVPKPQYRLPP